MNAKKLRITSISIICLYLFVICSTILSFDVKLASAASITVTNKSSNNPGYMWCWNGEGRWSSYSTTNGRILADDVGGEPKETIIYTHSTAEAPTTGWKDSNGKSYSFSEIKEITAVSAESLIGNNEDRTAGVEDDTKKVFINGKSGKGWPLTDAGNACGEYEELNYPFPINVDWTGTVTPAQGTLYISYFTESGASLSGVFPSEIKTMEIGSLQSFSLKSHADYTYSGYKKSSVSEPVGGTLSPGTPPSFNYDGSHPKYWVYYYYKAKTGVVIPEPEPEPEEPDPDPNEPPIAVIQAPDVVRQGDEFSPNGYMSRDPDGTIVNYYWETNGANGTITGGHGPIWYSSTGQKNISLAVEDNDGAFAATNKSIKVIEPFVYAHINVGGTKKENRKVILTNTSDTPKHYPITSAQWTIQGVSGASNGDIRYTGTLSDMNKVDTLFKKEGLYEVTLNVRNSAGYSDSTTTILNIQPDLLPIAQFSTPTWLYRDPMNSNYATIAIQDLSSSPDGDTIESHILKITYNKDNNYLANSIVINMDDPDPGLKAKTIYANFADDQILSIDLESLNVNLTYTYTIDGVPMTVLKKQDGIVHVKSKNVGRYLVEMSVTEGFGQPTIDEFVTAADRKSSNTNNKPKLEKIVTIDNRAPTVNFKP